MSSRTSPAAPLGLSEDEAQRRLALHGPNRLQQDRARPWRRIARDTVAEPMFLLLAAAALLYLMLGKLGEGLFMLASAVVSIGLVVMQELRSARALAALRSLAEPSVRALRDGAERRVPSHALVPGDVVLVGEGERIAADGVLIGGDALAVDESALTGESVPVEKLLHDPTEADPDGETEPGGGVSPLLFAGTLVVRGQGVARLLRTGAATRLGRIGESLVAIAAEPTPLQRSTHLLAARLGATAVVLCLAVVLLHGLLRGEWIAGALAALTLAIALVPEEFPMVLAIFMALGVWRLARRNVLVRRAAAVETLGAASVLCVDKTGTLTENALRLAAVVPPDGRLRHPDAALPESASHLLRIGLLASAVHPTDPIDRAVRVAAERQSHLPPAAGSPLRTFPVRPGRMAMLQAWSIDGKIITAAKGAPETIARMCRMDAAQEAELHANVTALAEQGLRVLGVAEADHLPETDAPEAETAAAPFRFAGLLGFADPLRADAAEAIATCRQAGVTVAMITGDYPSTALAIAGQAGIDTKAGVLTGPEIARLSPQALRRRVATTRVFARIQPEQKLAVVQALKQQGAIVAMTGDGINDAPALEAAHIGVAMGRRGTDVAREAADIVLLDDRFASIVAAVALGRRIFANLRKALTFVLAIHVPVAGLALLPIILGLPPMMLPMHVVLMEMIIDPVCSVTFENEPADPEVMRRAPRPADEALFGARHMLLAVVQGSIVLAATLAAYWCSLAYAVAEPEARSLGFTVLVAGVLALAFASSAEPGTPFFAWHRRAFFAIALAAVLVLGVIHFVSPLAAIFQVGVPEVGLVLPALALAVVAGGWPGIWRRSRALRRA